MTETEKEKLAKWAGFKYQRWGGEYIRNHAEGWIYPDNTFDKFLPDFLSSLDACFKWLVPQCHKKFGQVTVETMFNGEWEYLASIGNERSGIFTAKTPALALCLAIERLIDSESKGGKE
jgi:hypothetical protein